MLTNNIKFETEKDWNKILDIKMMQKFELVSEDVGKIWDDLSPYISTSTSSRIEWGETWYEFGIWSQLEKRERECKNWIVEFIAGI